MDHASFAESQHAQLRKREHADGSLDTCRGFAAPALSGFEGGQGRTGGEDRGVEAGEIQFLGGVGKEGTIRI